MNRQSVIKTRSLFSQGKKEYDARNYEAATEYFRVVAGRQEGLLGKYHKETIKTYWQLGKCCCKARKDKDALEAFLRTVRMAATSHSESTTKLLKDDIESCWKESFPERSTALEELYSIFKSEQQGDRFCKKKNFLGAIERYSRSLLNIQAILRGNTDSLDAADIRMKLGFCYLRISNLSAAEKAFQDAHACYVPRVGKDHPATQSASASIRKLKTLSETRKEEATIAGGSLSPDNESKKQQQQRESEPSNPIVGHLPNIDAKKQIIFNTTQQNEDDEANQLRLRMRYWHWLSKVKKDGWDLRLAPPNIRADKKIVLTAVRQYGWALQFASPMLQKDKEVVMAAVQNYAWALRFATPELRNDRVVVMIAVQQRGMALECASPELTNDKQIVMAAIKENPDAIKYAHENIKRDRDVLIAAGMFDENHDLATARQRLANNVAYNPNKKITLSTRFSLDQSSGSVATNFTKLFKQHQYIQSVLVQQLN